MDELLCPISNTDFDDWDDEPQDFEQVGTCYGTGKADFVVNKIGFGQPQLEKLPLRVVFDVKIDDNCKGKALCSLYLAVEVFGKEYELTANKKDYNELLKVLYSRFGGKYYEQ